MLVILGGVLVRIALNVFFPGFLRVLGDRVELSTAVTSFKRLKEGLFLLQNSMDPYAGGPFHASPLLLYLISIFPPSNLVYSVVFALLDGYAAWNLAEIAKRRPKQSFSPSFTAAVYLFNPFTMLGTLARSTLSFTNAAIIISVSAAVRQRPVQAAAFLALATCLSWYPIYLFFPLCVICLQYDHRAKSIVRYMCLAFCAFIGVFLVLEYLPLGSWGFLQHQIDTQLFLSDLTAPNLGLWWYFFIEMFDGFRPFFLGAFQLFIAIFPAPLTIRFPHHPLFVVAALVGLMAIFKPYPEVSDVGLYFSLLVLNRRICELLEFWLVTGLGLLYCSALAPTFFNLWIEIGSGNANFFYAITLVYALVMVVSIADATWSALRDDYDGGRATNLTQI